MFSSVTHARVAATGKKRKGSWFKTISHYTCPSCGHSVQMGYDEKIRLFEANAHRAIE
jgi:hypothetical protein